MTLDDGTAITIACGTIAALAGAVAWLWKAMDKRYQAELKADHKALIKRVRDLEDERIPTLKEHAEKIEQLADRYDATAIGTAQALTAVAKAVREIAQNVNSHTEAIKGMRCKTFDQGPLPEPHPAAKGTGAITKNQVHG